MDIYGIDEDVRLRKEKNSGLQSHEESYQEQLTTSCGPSFKLIRGAELVLLAVFAIKFLEFVVCFSTVASLIIQLKSIAEAGFLAMGLRRLGMIAGNETAKKMIYRNGSRITMAVGTLPLIA
jgi:hypothetical protein